VLEGEVGRLRAVNRDEHLERLDASRVAPRKRGLAYRRGGIFSARHPLGQPSRLGLRAARAQEAIDVDEAGTREYALIAYVIEFAREELQQLGLQAVARREVHVPALGRHRTPPPVL